MNCGACVVGCQQRNAVPYGFHRNWIRADASPRHGMGTGFQPGGCMQCEQPLCVEACPTRATWKDADGVVMIDRARCIGCGGCIAACPYDARFRHPTLHIADKCDYCASTRSTGVAPACVQLCPTRARVFGDADDPASEVAALLKGPVRYVESPSKPTLAYTNHTTDLNWPRRAEVPAPLRAMGWVGLGVKILGGLSLAGVVAVFLKQLVMPSDDESHDDTPPESAAHNRNGGAQ